jgi:uncharacterized protein
MTTTPQQLEANIITAAVDGGRIGDNILMFARVLRAAGMPVGPQKTVVATEAAMAVGLADQRAFYWALHAVFVNRRSEHELFHQAFVMFWKDPDFLKQMLSLVVPNLRGGQAADDKALSRRMSEVFFKGADKPVPMAEEQLEIDARDTFSDNELIRTKDFEQMSAEEMRRARALIARLTLPFEEIRTRRHAPASRGAKLDVQRMIRAMGRTGADHLPPLYRERVWRRPPLVLLVDISGSMDAYARVFLHFLHALSNDRDRVHAFLFGTRLDNITRTLRNRDPDVALAKVASDVTDWSGGTRIGQCLGEFNQRWARRVLGQNALVLLFTDGLDRDGGAGIEPAARRLAANCRRLIWLNPLLRYDRYAPQAAGAAALARHVSEIRPCHNLASLTGLVGSLAR